MPKNVLVQSQWDPFNDHEGGVLSTTAIARIKRDLMDLFKDPPPGLLVVSDESNLKIIHAIIVGVVDTPYEGGFFYFVIKCPNDYPIHPPKVKLMTTDAGNVRFNPNFYRNGKVCLSILGTWVGPAWSPATQVSGLLLSIQSLMTEKPYYNEPLFQNKEAPEESNKYNDLIVYQTLRVAVCGMVENECCLNMPPQLQEIMEKTFLECYDHYVEIAKENIKLDGTVIKDPLSNKKYKLDYTDILKRLEFLKEKMSAKYNKSREETGMDSTIEQNT